MSFKSVISNSSHKVPSPIIPNQPLLDKQNKFLQLFQSINNSTLSSSVIPTSQINKQNRNKEMQYMNKIQSYQESRISQIDRIVRMDDAETLTHKSQGRITKVQIQGRLRPQIKHNIQRINQFFSQDQSKAKQPQQLQQLLSNQVLQISTFSEILRYHPFPTSPTPQQLSIYNNANQHFHSNVTNNFNKSQNFNQSQQIFQPSEIKIRKGDLILVQILREKKRKGFVADYYKIMELKLFQLLDYVLQDQQEYQRLTSIQKMKLVLSKLDSFKGKKVQGQNKINLLKIFFQEFRNLKNQIAQSQKNKLYSAQKDKFPQTQKKKFPQSQKRKLPQSQSKKTPQKSQQRPKHPTKDYPQITNKQQKTPLKTPIKNITKKNITKDTMSMAGDKKQKYNDKGNKSVKGVEDQWLGELSYQ